MEWSLLGSLRDDDRRAVLASARRRKYAKGEVLFHEGDPGDTLHLIAKGKVAIRVTTPLGDTATLSVIGTGGSFGELALLRDDARRTASAVALEAVETMTLRREQVRELRDRHPLIDVWLVDALGRQVASLSAQLLEALYLPVETRVLRRLLGLTKLYGAGRPGTLIPLTQEDIAGMAGSTRPTVNRVLKEAEEEGLIRVSRGRVEVLDPSALHAKCRDL